MKTKTSQSVLTALLLALSFGASAACWEPSENFGQVSRIYPQATTGTPQGTFFSLKLGVTNGLPAGTTYYHISPTATTSTQAVYQSMSDLLLDAAKTGRVVRVRINSTTCNVANPEVAYIIADF